MLRALTAMIWKGKEDVCILINVHKPPAASNSRDKHRIHKTTSIEDCSWYICYIKKRDRMANRYSISHRTCKWSRNPFFSPVQSDSISYIILTSCGSQISSDFSSKFVENVCKYAWTILKPKRRIKLEIFQWLILKLYYTCSVNKKRVTTDFLCSRCEVGLCMNQCFRIFHKKVNFYITLLL
jgi:hypothetical protein